jgi:hypothetical protein
VLATPASLANKPRLVGVTSKVVDVLLGEALVEVQAVHVILRRGGQLGC